MYRKEIKYDRETRDYACYLDGELVGFAGQQGVEEPRLLPVGFVGHRRLSGPPDGGCDSERWSPYLMVGHERHPVNVNNRRHTGAG